MNKQALITLIADCMQQKGCHVIHAEDQWYSDSCSYCVYIYVHIVRAAVTTPLYNSITLTDLLALILYHYAAQNSRKLYFRSDKDKITLHVYDIKILKQLLGDEISFDLLFGHAFFGCDMTY